MGGAERVIFAFDPPGESRKPARLAQSADAISALGQNLMRIGLMADIPNEAVARRVEQIVERDRQLDNAETRAKVASGHRYGVDGFLPELRSELNEVPLRERPQILRRADFIQQRRGRFRRAADLISPRPFYITRS